MTKEGLLDIYSLFGWVTIGVGVVVLLLSPIVKRWMHLDTLEDRRRPGRRRASLASRRPRACIPSGETKA